MQRPRLTPPIRFWMTGAIAVVMAALAGGRVQAATEQTLQDLAACNDLYFERFGYIFIVCCSLRLRQHSLASWLPRLIGYPA